MIVVNIQTMEEALHSGGDSAFLLSAVYIFCSLLVLTGIIIIVLTMKIRRRVKRKHYSDMAILDDWNSAIRDVYSGNESEVLAALDKIWALSNPITYTEIQPIVNLFLNHNNKNISMRAQRIVEKQLSMLTAEPTINEHPPATT